MHSVCCRSLPVWRRRLLKKGTPCDQFLPRPGSAPGRIWPKNNNTCKGPWVLHPYQVSSKSIKRFWIRSWKCESLQTDDGRTDDGRCAMTIAHLSLCSGELKSKVTRQTATNTVITQRLQTDFARPVRATATAQLVLFNRLNRIPTFPLTAKVLLLKDSKSKCHKGYCSIFIWEKYRYF